VSTLEIKDLTVRYGTGSRAHVAVDRVSLTVPSGTTLGLVGESGSGKSSIAAAVVGLVQPAGGDIFLDRASLVGPSAAAKAARRRVQLIFQDPFSALDPKLSIGESVAEATRATGRRWTRAAARERVQELLERVGVEPGRAADLPGRFSGGQRQRITIARALAGEPDLLIADEITSALDVSVQGMILNLLRDLQAELNLTVLFISHNLAVVRYVSHSLVVMKDGRIVEAGETEALLARPKDHYTAELVGAVPVLGHRFDADTIALAAYGRA
jgi:peptide/nickel transport system ATP-binding protein